MHTPPIFEIGNNYFNIARNAECMPRWKSGSEAWPGHRRAAAKKNPASTTRG